MEDWLISETTDAEEIRKLTEAVKTYTTEVGIKNLLIVLAAIFDRLLDPVVIFDQDRKIIYANLAMTGNKDLNSNGQTLEGKFCYIVMSCKGCCHWDGNKGFDDKIKQFAFTTDKTKRSGTITKIPLIYNHQYAVIDIFHFDALGE